jgi:hypothetical protein
MDTVAVCGHPVITYASVREMKGVSGSEYVVDTQGCSLFDFSASECVDWNMSYSNDIQEILSLFGIEAAAATLYQELTSTISFDGTYVDPRHIHMIVNTMTFRGFVMPLSRHGINRLETGPLLRCSFEETPDILCDAACFSERDNGLGVSQNIMTGKLPQIGSGCMTIMMPKWSFNPRTMETAKPTGRVLKSIVRDAKASNVSQECDPPFHTATNQHGEGNRIFAQKECDLPYVETAMVEETSLKRIYKPSSPVSRAKMQKVT